MTMKILILNVRVRRLSCLFALLFMFYFYSLDAVCLRIFYETLLVFVLFRVFFVSF